jgi:single-strand DNA-binding protein
MASLNRCCFIGNLTRDPEVKFLTNGEAVANCSIAVNESWKDKNGDKQERVEFVNLTFYRKLAEIAGQYLKKGALTYVEGKMQTRKWQDKEGHDRYTTDIIVDQMQMLGGKKDGEQSDTADHQAKEVTKPAPKSASFDDFEDDLIPF